MRRYPNRAATELTAYFLSGESDQGLQSSWEPLAAAAQGGFGGSPDTDRRAYRHRLGPGYSAIGQARLVRSALKQLPAQAVEVLWAAHGPTPWGKIIDASFGNGTQIRVTKRLGDLAAVALLCPAVLRASEDKPGVYLIACCLDPKGTDRCQAIVAQARGMLREAERSYLDARGFLKPQPVQLPQQPPEAPRDFFSAV